MTEKIKQEKIINLPCVCDPGKYERCPICGRAFLPSDIPVARKLWADLGGRGHEPPEAMVHIRCECLEQMAIQGVKPPPGLVGDGSSWGKKSCRGQDGATAGCV